MAAGYYTLDDFDVAGKTVLVRVDINSPIDPGSGRILNDARIREHLVTVRDLRGAKVVLLAHQSRPGKDDYTTLEPHAERLSYLLGRKVRYGDSLFGASALEAVRGMAAGDVVLLENARFFAEEEALADAKPEKMARTHLVQRLSPLAEYFCIDAFAAAHRAQPTLVGFAEVLPTMAGRVMQRELEMLDRAIHASERPKIAVFGGIKIDDSIGVTRPMLAANVVDRVLAIGGVGTAFLQAQGHDPGKPTTEFMHREIEDYGGLVDQCKLLLAKYPDRIGVPTDVVVNDGGKRHGLNVKELPSTHQVADVGLDTIVRFSEEIAKAKTVFLNGPAGIFEIEEFSTGTRELFHAVANSSAFSVVGGGHTVAAVEQYGLQDKIGHVSTGGGALINYLAGRPLPVVEALYRSRKKFPKSA